MAQRYDYCVLIGRFQPPHKAHIEVMKRAMEIGDCLLVVLGSANAARNIKNPFSDAERTQMIEQALRAESVDLSRVEFAYVRDQIYSLNGWIMDMQQAIRQRTKGRVCLVGHRKDDSSYYLDVFKEWDFRDVGNIQDNLSSSAVREALFSMRMVLDALPDGVKEFLYDWIKGDEFSRLEDEWRHVQDYRSQWSRSPYPPIFVTADAIVIQSGHVLLVKRRAQPGKGQWALPGGFIRHDERIETAIIRELKEETRIKLPLRALRDKMRKIQVFDAPERSLRGRTITHAGLIALDDAADLPKVKGSDDAEVAAWFPLDRIAPSFLYEDHYDIIKAMTGGL